MYQEELTPEIKEKRSSSYDISPLILNRWSPRSMSGETMSNEELYPLFEAARWAPSSFNGQLWRFLFARRENEEQFSSFLQLLDEGNQTWCKNASALVVVSVRTLFEYNDKPDRTSPFTAGAAFENLCLEASRRGFVAHGMAGFDFDKAKNELGMPEEYEVLAMIAIGKRAPKEELDEELQKMEEPSDRRPLSEIVFEGKFGNSIE